MVALVALLGVVAGLLTTLAGMGGGVMLLLALSLFLEPSQALAATAPALLLGNLHRVILFHRSVDWQVGGRFAAGGLPGSLLGGFLVSLMPDGLVRWMMVALLVAGILVGTGTLRFTAPRWAAAPGGALVGALAATAGGAGVLAAPLLMGMGLTGEAYVSTSALGAVAMHLGRIAAYGAGGLMTPEVMHLAGILTVTVLLGNALGKRVRPFLDVRQGQLLERATLAVSAALALGGLLH